MHRRCSHDGAGHTLQHHRPYRRPLGVNLRSALVLLAGTALAFGVQVLYDSREHYRLVKR
jgi:hypothetical protein